MKATERSSAVCDPRGWALRGDRHKTVSFDLLTYDAEFRDQRSVDEVAGREQAGIEQTCTLAVESGIGKAKVRDFVAAQPWDKTRLGTHLGADAAMLACEAGIGKAQSWFQRFSLRDWVRISATG